MPWNGDKKSWRGEAVKLRHTLACRVWGGGGYGRFKTCLGMVTRSLGKVKL